MKSMKMMGFFGALVLLSGCSSVPIATIDIGRQVVSDCHLQGAKWDRHGLMVFHCTPVNHAVSQEEISLAYFEASKCRKLSTGRQVECVVD